MRSWQLNITIQRVHDVTECLSHTTYITLLKVYQMQIVHDVTKYLSHLLIVHDVTKKSHSFLHVRQCRIYGSYKVIQVDILQILVEVLAQKRTMSHYYMKGRVFELFRWISFVETGISACQCESSSNSLKFWRRLKSQLDCCECSNRLLRVFN